MRRGIALFAALAVLALLGLLIVGAVTTTTLGQRAARLAVADQRLDAAADYALGQLLSDPARFALADLPFAHARSFAVPVVGSSDLQASVTVTRLPGEVYWFVADVTTQAGERGRRQVNVVARGRTPGPVPRSATVAAGTTSLAPDVVVTTEAGSEADCASTGAPAPVQTSDSASLFMTDRQLAALAATPGARWVRGDTSIAGSFDGILIVDGALTTVGPFNMTGIAVVRGRIRSAAGLRLTGALISQAGDSPAIDLAGAALEYAPCIVARMLRHGQELRRVRARGWAEIF